MNLDPSDQVYIIELLHCDLKMRGEPRKDDEASGVGLQLRKAALAPELDPVLRVDYRTTLGLMRKRNLQSPHTGLMSRKRKAEKTMAFCGT